MAAILAVIGATPPVARSRRRGDDDERRRTRTRRPREEGQPFPKHGPGRLLRRPVGPDAREDARDRRRAEIPQARPLRPLPHRRPRRVVGLPRQGLDLRCVRTGSCYRAFCGRRGAGAGVAACASRSPSRPSGSRRSASRCSPTQSLKRPIGSLRVHLARLARLFGTLDATTRDEHWSGCWSNIHMAAALQGVEIDTDIYGDAMWCGPASDFEAASRQASRALINSCVSKLSRNWA